MTNPENDETLGVFGDRDGAEAAAQRAREAGVDDSRIRVGDDADSQASLKAEMREEMEEAWFSPQAAFVATKEAAKGLSLATPIAAAAGAVIALPFAFIFTFGSTELWLRIVVALVIGAMAGGTVGLIISGGMTIKGPDEPLAAERGVTLRVADAGADTVQALEQEEPIRLDTVAPSGRKTSTVETEEERTGSGVVDRLFQKAREPEGDWSRTREREDD
jgi:hypothetical protein